MFGMVAGVAYVWLAQGLAFLLMPRAIAFDFRLRALLFWAVTAPLVLLVEQPMITLLVAGLLLLLLSPTSTNDRTAFFIVAVPAVPVSMFAMIPFPGINYLTSITHYKLAALILLLPVLLSRRHREEPAAGFAGPVGAALLIYVAYTAALISTPQGFTAAMRFAVDQILLLAFPFFAILRSLRRPKDIERLFQAILVVSLILAMVALVSNLKHWDIYAVGALLGSESRDGILRINATSGTHSLAFNLAAGLLVLEYLKRRLQLSWLYLNLMRAILFLGMLTTDSRGALMGLLIAFCVYTVFILRSNWLRSALLIALFAGGAGAAIWLARGNVGDYDLHGTFAYRQELLRTSVDYILKHPLFGDREFLQSGAFDHLRQGQGIIDITNMYLQVALNYGLMGLAIFAGAFVLPVVKAGRKVLRVVRSNPHVLIKRHDQAMSDNEIWYRATAVSVAMGVGWLALIATTSDVGLTLHLGVVFAAFCCALQRMHADVQVMTAAEARVEGAA